MFWTFEKGSIKRRRAKLGGKYPMQTFYSLAYSDKGYCCAGSRDGSLYIFVGDVCKKVVKGLHKGKLLTIDSFDGGLVTGGSDKKVFVLNRKLAVSSTLSFPHSVCSVHLDGEQLLVGTQGSEIFEVPNFAGGAADRSFSFDNAVVHGHFDGETWACEPSPDGLHLISAGEDNQLLLWDMDDHRLVKHAAVNEKAGKRTKRTKASTTSTHPPNQCARAVSFSPDGAEFCVGSNDGAVGVFRTADMHKITALDLNQYGTRQVKNQKQNWIQTIAYSPDGRTIAVGTHGSSIVLIDVDKGHKVGGVIKAHNSFLTHLDWSVDGTKLQSTCGAYELLFHDINQDNLSKSQHNPRGVDQFRDTEWASQTCIFGYPVQGIFDPSQDGTDINSVHRSPDGTLCVTGDDYGFVNLFRYPVNHEEGHKSKQFEAHSSHVPTVRFTLDGKRVVSSGGGDKAVMQWLVRG